MKLAKILKVLFVEFVSRIYVVGVEQVNSFSASIHLEIHFEQLLNMAYIPFRKVSTFRATCCKFYSQAQRRILNDITSKMYLRDLLYLHSHRPS